MILYTIGIIPVLLFILLSGFLMLYLHPRWKLDLVNMIFFAAGAFLAVITVSVTADLLFPIASGPARPASVIYMILMALCMVGGGYAGVSAWQRITRRRMESEK